MQYNETEKDFCFCTLALGERYHFFAQQLARDLEKYSPGTFFVVLSDRPKKFVQNKNVLALKHRQESILNCYNDKRFAIKEALARFGIAIYIDADTRIIAPFSESLSWQPGISGFCENLLKHMTKNKPQHVDSIKRLAFKLGVSLDNTRWIGEALFVVVRDQGKEEEFIDWWGKAARYLELKGMHSGSGNVMGLAAAKVGWAVMKNNMNELRMSMKHSKAFFDIQPKKCNTIWKKLIRAVNYRYRLHKTRLISLNDFDFYYK